MNKNARAQLGWPRASSVAEPNFRSRKVSAPTPHWPPRTAPALPGSRLHRSGPHVPTAAPTILVQSCRAGGVGK